MHLRYTCVKKYFALHCFALQCFALLCFAVLLFIFYFLMLIDACSPTSRSLLTGACLLIISKLIEQTEIQTSKNNSVFFACRTVMRLLLHILFDDQAPDQRGMGSHLEVHDMIIAAIRQRTRSGSATAKWCLV